jgi:hypothetical protein
MRQSGCYVTPFKTDSGITLLICALHLTYLLLKKISVELNSEFNLNVSNRTLGYLIYFYLRLPNS